MAGSPSPAASFEDLSVWQGHGRRLPWYFAVATNRRPAKYLVARRVPVEADLDLRSPDAGGADTGALWDVHADATRRFLDAHDRVASGTADLADLGDEADPSLLDLSVALVDRLVRDCTFCEWECHVDRGDAAGKRGTCQLDTTSRVGSFFHHRGEERVFQGTGGSGTIFFTSCNMRCGFCQNGDISTDKDRGVEMTPRHLALAAWMLRLEGCHNVNWVGGEPVIHLHTIVKAIAKLGWLEPTPGERERIGLAKADGDLAMWPGRYDLDPKNADHAGEFNVPILWNSNFFLSEDARRILRPLVDVWLPDLKFGPGDCAVKLSRTPWYWETVTGNIETVHGWGEDLLVRHLIMPEHVECCTRPCLEWLAEHTPDVPVNVMDQYHPDCHADPRSDQYDDRFEEIARYPTAQEVRDSYAVADELGLEWEQVSLE